MRVRELQQYLGKFTNNEKGTVISDCPVYIETQDGHLEEIRRIELQENKIIGAPEPARLEDGDLPLINRVELFQGTGAEARVEAPYIIMILN